jgi:hypothetical protein
MPHLTRLSSLAAPRGKRGARGRSGRLWFGIGLLLFLVSLAAVIFLPREPVARLEHSLAPAARPEAVSR